MPIVHCLLLVALYGRGSSVLPSSAFQEGSAAQSQGVRSGERLQLPGPSGSILAADSPVLRASLPGATCIQSLSKEEGIRSRHIGLIEDTLVSLGF